MLLAVLNIALSKITQMLAGHWKFGKFGKVFEINNVCEK
jgi:hypothetical protein